MAPHPDTPSDGTLLEDLPFHLARAALDFRRFNDRTLRAVALDSQAPGIASVLHALDEQVCCTVKELIGRTHLPNGTLTGLLDTLERDRCVQRVPNPDDGRSWHVRLTPKGRRVCTRLRQRHRMVMQVLGETLSDDEAAVLKRLLARVTARMRAYTPEGPAMRKRADAIAHVSTA
jgi:DNA-binding MarR family transcriptional regulator